MQNLFKENRLVFLSPPDRPSSGAETNETAKLAAISTKFYEKVLKKNVEKNYKGLDESKQKDLIKKFLLTSTPNGAGYIEFKGVEDPFTGFPTETKYKDDKSNWVPYDTFHALKNNIHKWCKNSTNIAKVKSAIKVAPNKATPVNKPRSTASKSNFETDGFPASSQEEADRNARFAEKLYGKIVKVMANQYLITDKEDGAKAQKKMNSKLNKYGVNAKLEISTYIRATKDRKGRPKEIKRTAVSYEVEFNGSKAWPYINNPKKIKTLYKRLTGQTIPRKLARIPRVVRKRA